MRSLRQRFLDGRALLGISLAELAGLTLAAITRATEVPTILSFSLMYAGTAGPVPGFDPLTNGAVIDTALVGTNLNIRANTSPASDFGSVVFQLSGATTHVRTENADPWALFGNTGSNYNSGSFNCGLHTLTATPFDTAGNKGVPLTISFTVRHPTCGGATTVLLTQPSPGALFYEPAAILLEAIVTNHQVTVTNVAFYADDTKLGEVARAPYRWLWTDVSQGAYFLTARATDTNGAVAISTPCLVSVLTTNPQASISGELKKWHRVSITFIGPFTSETHANNPFRNYRLDVTFTHPATGKSYRVPGFFAADGNAADTGADRGDRWRVHFAPDETGPWHYVASFRAGPDVVTNASPAAGVPTAFDGASGSFVVGPTDKAGRDLRGKGRLQYVGKHHLRFAETGEYFLKMGADSPENLLDYEDFDDQPNVNDRRKSWSAHAADYDPTEASQYTWKDGRGTELLGAIKYLADKGMNAFSFIPFTLDGDDHAVFPHRLVSTVTAFENAAPPRWNAGVVYHDRFDVSKLEQWDRIFAYADQKGMYLHFKTLETENELLMDGGNLGVERILYYRELIARFGYHLALNWNLGEEINDATTAQKQAWSQYFYDTDPYHHHQVIHNGANHFDLLGNASKLTGFSRQASPDRIFADTLIYVHRSATNGRPWVVAYDEQNPANDGIVTDAEEFYHDSVRGLVIWSHLLAGGAGVESYFGYAHPHNDLTCQDFRSRDNWWNQKRYALEFFYSNAVPFWAMTNRDALISGLGGAHCLALTGQVYVVYLPRPASLSLNLSNVAGTFAVQWFDPRHGGPMQTGSVHQVIGGRVVSLGLPPSTSTNDWVALVRRLDSFAWWQQRLFTPEQLANAAISGPDADPDGDGLTNAAEYALGGRPLVADSGLLPTAVIVRMPPPDSAAYLAMLYRRRLDLADVSYLHEVASSLFPADWQSGPANVSVQTLERANGFETVRVLATTPISAAAQRFLRLRIVLESQRS
jgi:hypothetical protein